jgi:TusA-related sulfurtransferase
MTLIASWMDKSWEVSVNRIYNLENLSTTFKLKTDKNEDKEGTPPINVRGNELIPLSFEVPLSDVAGVDVRAEIDSWAKLVGGSGPFYLGGKRFGPERMQLQTVDVGDVIIDDLGRIRSARLSLEFEEDASVVLNTSDASGTSAMSVGASTEDKSSMKPVNGQLANSSSTGITAGSKIKIVGTDYATGQKIPQWVKDKTHIVTKISGEKALVGGNGGINSWVYLKDLSLA